MIDPSSTKIAACFDIGGTKALTGFVDSGGNILAEEKFRASPGLEPSQLVKDLAVKIHALAVRSGIDWEQVCGLGYSTTGMMDITSGIIFSSPNQGNWHDVPIRKLLSNEFKLPAWIEMDANAAALGEAWMGQGAGCEYFVHVIIGTGVSSGILVRGEILRGWRGTAGEFGHTVIDPDGPLCNCGGHGCLESLASGPAIAGRARRAVQAGQPSRMTEPLSAQVVFDAARQGDELAQKIVADTIGYLSIGLTNLIHLINPQIITIGGGVGNGASDLLIEPLRIATHCRVGNWVDMHGTHILPSKLGENAGLLGASRLVWKGLAQA